MKIIVALGNPGKKYELNRHNAGWLALKYIITSINSTTGGQLSAIQNKFNSEILHAEHSDLNLLNSDRIIFVKPQTFMNLSGTAVSQITSFYKADPKKDLLVIHDEIDLPFGTVRFTSSSSSAGHNGVKDIIENLGTQDFCRIRIGVESRASRGQIPTDAFVLQNFTEEEIKKLREEIFPKVKSEVEKFLSL